MDTKVGTGASLTLAAAAAEAFVLERRPRLARSAHDSSGQPGPVDGPVDGAVDGPAAETFPVNACRFTIDAFGCFCALRFHVQVYHGFY